LAKGAELRASDLVPAIIKNSPADKAGLKAGDIITRINSQEINADNDLAVILSSYSPGDSIILDYLRQGNNLQVEIILDSVK